jgi:NADH-quinone oxidoreductase subunit N
MMAVMMFSYIGLPPLGGFFAKWLVFLAAIDAHLFVLAVIGVLASAVSAFYYLRVVKVMYFDEPVDTRPIEARLDVRAVLSANGLAVLLLGLLPGGLMALCVRAIVQALAT